MDFSKDLWFPRVIEFNYGDKMDEWLLENKQKFIDGIMRLTGTHYTGTRHHGTSILVEYKERA